MTLEQLRIFVAVAERQHMTRAAEALHITQSAASAGVAALEARYGVALFDRVGRGLALTDAGQVFLPQARAVLAAAAGAVQALDDLAGLRHGHLRIAASQTVASYWLPHHLARFAEAYPGLTIKLQVGNTAQAAQALIDGDADLALVEGLVEAAQLRRQPVAPDWIRLYAAPGHPLAGAPVSPWDLAEASWVLREPGSGTRAQTERGLRARGVDPSSLRIALELPSNEAALAALAGGAFVTAVSELAAEALVAAGRVIQLDFDFTERRFELLSHRERHVSAAARAFIGLLTAAP